MHFVQNKRVFFLLLLYTAVLWPVQIIIIAGDISSSNSLQSLKYRHCGFVRFLAVTLDRSEL
jgi:hypothetical protein